VNLLRGTPILSSILILLIASPAYAWGPLDPSDADEDPDGDGLDNLGEFLAGTNPFDPDTDGGGCPDGWEVTHGLDPTNSKDETWDGDNDGWSNYREFLEGTDPNEPNTDNDYYLLDSTDPHPLVPDGPTLPPEDQESDDWRIQGNGDDMGQGQDGRQGNLPGTGDRPYQGSDMSGIYNEGTHRYWRSERERPKDADFDGLVEFITSL